MSYCLWKPERAIRSTNTRQGMPTATLKTESDCSESFEKAASYNKKTTVSTLAVFQGKKRIGNRLV
jgi:hypothetical protein